MFLTGAIVASATAAAAAVEDNRQFEQRMSLLTPEQQTPIREARAKRQEASRVMAEKNFERATRQSGMGGLFGFILGLIVGGD